MKFSIILSVAIEVTFLVIPCAAAGKAYIFEPAEPEDGSCTAAQVCAFLPV